MMTDRELNILVAKQRYGHNTLCRDIADTSSEIAVYRIGFAPFIVDYCNDLALSFQIALDHKISVVCDIDGGTVATSNSIKASQELDPSDYFFVSDHSPARAIVKCYLLMKGIKL